MGWAYSPKPSCHTALEAVEGGVGVTTEAFHFNVDLFVSKRFSFNVFRSFPRQMYYLLIICVIYVEKLKVILVIIYWKIRY